MRKASSKKHSRNLLVAIVAVVVVIVLAAFFFTLFSQKSVQNDAPTETPKEGVITVKGTALCLPHKDTSGPQTMECAFGLKDEQGRYYALGDTDPNYRNVSSLPMNKQVEGTGTFEKGSSERYPTIGTIKVTKVTTQ